MHDPFTRREESPCGGSKSGHSCETEVALIPRYLSGELNARDLAAFDRHLNACRDCTAFLKTYRRTIQITRRLFRAEAAKNSLSATFFRQ